MRAAHAQRSGRRGGRALHRSIRRGLAGVVALGALLATSACGAFGGFEVAYYDSYGRPVYKSVTNWDYVAKQNAKQSAKLAHEANLRRWEDQLRREKEQQQQQEYQQQQQRAREAREERVRKVFRDLFRKQAPKADAATGPAASSTRPVSS